MRFGVATHQLATPEIWFVCGSQHLYGPGPLEEVVRNAREVAETLDASGQLPLRLVYKALLTTPEEIRARCLEASGNPNCAGLVLWMHTFSPSRMWTFGLSVLGKPFCHLHTRLREFRNELRQNDLYYTVAQGLRN